MFLRRQLDSIQTRLPAKHGGKIPSFASVEYKTDLLNKNHCVQRPKFAQSKKVSQIFLTSVMPNIFAQAVA